MKPDPANAVVDQFLVHVKSQPTGTEWSFGVRHQPHQGGWCVAWIVAGRELIQTPRYARETIRYMRGVLRASAKGKSLAQLAAVQYDQSHAFLDVWEQKAKEAIARRRGLFETEGRA